MDTLPPEILAQIVDNVAEVYIRTKSYRRDKYGAQFAQYSPISRAWQATIEQITFKEFTITTDELDAFAALFSGNKISRLANLTILSIVFILPSLPNEPGCCPVEQTPDREAESVVFSASVVRLFTILADLTARAIEQPSLLLCFYKGICASGVQEFKRRTRLRCEDSHSRKQIMEAKAASGQFELVCEDAIPALRGIETFEYLDIYDLEDLKPSWIPRLVNRLVGLKNLLLKTEDLYSFGRTKRVAQRECA
jgi:hypothetical protein